MPAAIAMARIACHSMPSSSAGRNADVDDADHLAGGIKHRLIGCVEAAPEQHRRAFVGLATAKHGLPGMICRKLGADRPVAIFLFDVGGSANELLRCIVVDEKRSIAPDIGGGPVHDPVIGKFGHLRNFDAINDPVANGDLRIRERFAKCQTQRAKAEVDIPLRTEVKVACQRPVARSDQQRGIYRDQQRRAHDGFGPKIQPRKGETPSRQSERHWGVSGRSGSINKDLLL